ncbi:restriction endonuclease subunit S [Mycoplasmopsis fermentans]|uniref:Type I restriction-modification system, S subunit n=1 Tax=Mycoplasmopsis fermentans (strain M64) TaxID=943945 RepID=A0AB32XC59_MYCFM|nr:restriction endonuclease subunit S [Mycoplasmopsis fermentans]ADV34594.1 Type I restriction-modification system, S subunit [Mycoplasmopsis fermentans M64]
MKINRLTAEQLRKSILQLAIQGKLVKQDPNDEPASKLIERIYQEKQKLIKEGKIKKDKQESFIFKGEDNHYYEKIGKNIKDITEELPFEIPENWMWVRLKNISIINGGFAFKSSEFVSKENGIRILRISDFDERGLKNNNIVYYKYESKMFDYFLNNKNIVICMTGGTVGKSLLIKELKEKILVNQRVGNIKILNEMLPDYVDIVMKSELISKIIRKNKNSTNDNISIELIKLFFIPVPSIEEQLKIIVKYNKLLTQLTLYKNIFLYIFPLYIPVNIWYLRFLVNKTIHFSTLFYIKILNMLKNVKFLWIFTQLTLFMQLVLERP